MLIFFSAIFFNFDVKVWKSIVIFPNQILDFFIFIPYFYLF